MNRQFWHTVFSVIKNKYFITLVGFTLWILIFDQQNLIDRFHTRKHLNQLKKDTTYYQNLIDKERGIIFELQTSPENLEKFAREHYMMKAADEDLFIILKE